MEYDDGDKEFRVPASRMRTVEAEREVEKPKVSALDCLDTAHLMSDYERMHTHTNTHTHTHAPPLLFRLSQPTPVVTVAAVRVTSVPYMSDPCYYCPSCPSCPSYPTCALSRLSLCSLLLLPPTLLLLPHLRTVSFLTLLHPLIPSPHSLSVLPS